MPEENDLGAKEVADLYNTEVTALGSVKEALGHDRPAHSLPSLEYGKAHHICRLYARQLVMQVRAHAGTWALHIQGLTAQILVCCACSSDGTHAYMAYVITCIATRAAGCVWRSAIGHAFGQGHGGSSVHTHPPRSRPINQIL